MRSALICHTGDSLNEEGFSRWLASFSDLRLIVRINDPRSQVRKRVRAEQKRSGFIGLLDVFAFRLWYRVFRKNEDVQWQSEMLAALRTRFPPCPAAVRIITVDSPNRPEVAAALATESIDFAFAPCKRILSAKILSIPKRGIFVVHPGICPEYRNAHGCFWAVVRDDRDKVGATLLRIDEGIDTGPVIGYFRRPFDPRRESHIRIQHRVVFENLEWITPALLDYLEGTSLPLPTTGRASAVWGQPRLSSHLRWRWRNRGSSSPML
jgi:hypothetical protein